MVSIKKNGKPLSKKIVTRVHFSYSYNDRTSKVFA